MDFTCLFKPIVEFNVPPSNPDGSINPADPDDQYVVDPLSIQYGDDWCYFGVWRNGNTSLCPFEAQDYNSYDLVTSVPPANGSTLRVTGFGRDYIPLGRTGGGNTGNFAQQTATGPYQDRTSTQVLHGVDTEAGSSGSPIEHVSSSLVYAIHTFGDCDNTTSLDAGGNNGGTRIDNPGLQAALASPKGVCGDCDENGIPNGCENTGACCMSHSPSDCRYITECECAAEGIWWYGERGNCSQINCFLAPSGPQQAP
jgi:hypothetical protein